MNKIAPVRIVPRKLAQTRQLPTSLQREQCDLPALEDGDEFFKSIEWSADGTSLIATAANGDIATYIVPPDLCDEHEEPLPLAPYAIIIAPEPVNSVVGYPFFDLQHSTSALVLSSLRDHPIRLNSALSTNLVASYPWVNPMTEAFINPHSMLFTPDGQHFVAGTDSFIATFDVSRPGDQAISCIKTGSKGRSSTWESRATSIRGIISAMSYQPESNVLAAGTFSRQIGLYGSSGRGGCIAAFSVKGTDAEGVVGGSGVTQLMWSSCGRYLYIAERRSDGALIYDIRNTGQLAAWIVGRNANTNQRMHIDMRSTESGSEIWAGGIDGKIRCWRNSHQSEGAVTHDDEWQAHRDVISGAVIHHGVNVIASISGQRRFDIDQSPSLTSGNSPPNDRLSLWQL